VRAVLELAGDQRRADEGAQQRREQHEREDQDLERAEAVAEAVDQVVAGRRRAGRQAVSEPAVVVLVAAQRLP
jgi:hypothetical protein